MAPGFGFRRLVLAASAAWLGACMHACATPAGPIATASTEATYADFPVRLCLGVDRADWPSLRDGSRRLALHVRNENPSPRYSPTFTVHLADEGTRAAAPIDTFTMAADTVDPQDTRTQPQHFLIDLRDALHDRPASNRLCIELALDRDGRHADAPSGCVAVSANFEITGN